MMEMANLCRWMNRAVFSLGADSSGALSQLSSVKLSAIEVEKEQITSKTVVGEKGVLIYNRFSDTVTSIVF
ncbi:hypothetical protein B4W73_02970 [Staphylococcus delphini]|nr:hypothetical protein B5B98_06565 [Staphylococcus delphini]PCF77270.1 hypothetical protein B4W73_02970 [Staphylococcus delphini]